jgi:hypothetical protein
MRRRSIRRLALSLGLLITGGLGAAHGQVATTTPSGAAAAVGLDRPVPVARTASPADPDFRPVSYGPLPQAVAAVTRGTSPDVGLERPQPAIDPTQTASVTSNSMFQWRRPPEEFAAGAVQPSGLISAAAAGQPPSGPAVAAPVVTTDPLRSIVRPGAEPEQLPFPTPAPDPGPVQGPPAGAVDPRVVPAWPATPVITDGAFCGQDCGGYCCDPGCGDCLPRARVYFQAEYLLWWLRAQKLPPLVSEGTLAGNPPGALGQPGTTLLFGNREVNDRAYSGARFLLGGWFTEGHGLGVEIGGLFLGSQNTHFSDTSFGDRIIVRNLQGTNVGNPADLLSGAALTRFLTTGVPPSFAIPGAETTELVAGTDPTSGTSLAGTVAVDARTSMWGAEANLRTAWWCGPNGYLDGLLGFRMLGLDDRLSITESLRVVSAPTMPAVTGTTFLINDSFRTTNRFYGPQFGVTGRLVRGDWSLDYTGKLGLGTTQQVVDITGGTQTTIPGAGTMTFQRGVLAQPTNIGRHTRDVFGVVPEIGFNVGYQFTDHCRGYIGYNLIYWNSVVRAGDEIDRAVNVRQLPRTGAQTPPDLVGDRRPAFTFRGSDFWAQGVTFGLELTY